MLLQTSSNSSSLQELESNRATWHFSTLLGLIRRDNWLDKEQTDDPQLAILLSMDGLNCHSNSADRSHVWRNVIRLKNVTLLWCSLTPFDEEPRETLFWFSFLEGRVLHKDEETLPLCVSVQDCIKIEFSC